MARAAGGRVLSPGVPGQGMNPFVIDKGDSEELLQRIGSLRRLIEVMIGESLGAERRASLDHALAGYYARPRERTGFRDFYAFLEQEAGDLARLLRPFATGSLRNLLSDEGDDLLGNEALITVFDLRLLEPELRPAAAMVCTETVWAAAAQDPKPRLLVVDEVWSIMQHPEGAAFMVSMAKRARKHRLGLQFITQDVQDLLSEDSSRTITGHSGRALLQNAAFKLLLQQDAAAIGTVGDAFDLPQDLQSWLLSCPRGDGLLLARGNRFPDAHRGHPGGDRGDRVAARTPLEKGLPTMKLNPKNILFGDDEGKKGPVLLAVTPPRSGERTLLGVENLLQSIAVPEPFSLELAGDMDGVTLMARCLDDKVVRGQLSAHYPQARIQQVDPGDDPLRLEEGEKAWSITLRADAPEYVPLRTFRDDDLLDPGSDPLIALMGALSALYEGERVVARLMLRSLGPDWSQAHMDKAHKMPGMAPREPAYTFQTKPLQLDGITMAVLGLGALAALKGYLWVQDGEIWKAALLGTGTAIGMAAGGWAWWRWKKSRNRVEDPILIKEKVSRIAFDAELQVVAVLPADTGQERARELLGTLAAAYRHYDNPAGARFKVSSVRPAAPDPEMLHPAGSGLFGRRSVLGVREVASLWHPPGAGDETPLVERSGARALSPSAKGVRGGALVGDTTAGANREIRFPEDLLRRHHLYVARTRMGKSTLMHHLAVHKMREKAAGRDPDAIIVVDPHTDLVEGLMQHVPESLTGRVRLIDLSDETRASGINLLDTRIFSDRDRTADSVVRVAKGLWEQWGPRMQSILEQTVKTLHEANEQVEAEQQYTILDGLKLLSNEPFRKDVLKKVSDPYLLEWWASTFTGWSRDYKADSLAPVQTRLSYYASSKRARAILGQRRSTIDLRRVIHDGGVLLVSTSQGTVGRDVAALVGASLLNLVDAVIREQGSVSLRERRGALVVVDEMQSMPGVDYESMLSELGKFGASFILATQSLAKLDDLSRTMRDTILANVGCLAVFQVSGADARTLVWELGKERVTEDDITSLPVHHCYVRATVGKERMPAFSMMVRKPEEGDPAVADRIREAASAYTVSGRQADYADADGRRKVDDYRKGLEDIEKGGAQEEKPDAGQEPERRKQTSRRRTAAADPVDDVNDEQEAGE